MKNRLFRYIILAMVVCAIAAVSLPQTHASAVPSVSMRFVARWRGLTRPLGIENVGDGTGRLFIIEQDGRIRVVSGGVLQATPFLDLTGKVARIGSEQGLLGLAFPPGFSADQHFYVDYTNLAGDTVIARYQVSAGDPNVADPASEEVLLTVDQPFTNHNGGQLVFGPDGYLYIGMGDGGSGGDPQGNAQNTNSLLGKVLRIDVEGGAVPYGIPPTNPFVGDPGGRDEIWALGLRNPWRFSFDRTTGDLWIADVGQASREEVDFEPAASGGGRNYGWNRYEGSLAYPIGSVPTPTTGLTFPVHEYDHTTGGQSITGGFVYRGTQQPAFAGLYFFADFVRGKFWAMDPADHSVQTVLDTDMLPSSFGQDQTGEIYVADFASGTVSQVLDAAVPPATSLTRLSGATRYETARAVALDAFPLGSTTAVLATGEKFPDALAASGLAGALDAPVLLTPTNALSDAVVSALRPGELGASNVVIVGGPAAVSPDVASMLVGRGYNVTRVSGADRYETAAAVAKEVARIEGGAFEGNVFVVRGDSFPDALAAAPLAHAGHGPILLTRSTSLPAATSSAIADIGATGAVVVGGTAAIADTVPPMLGVPSVRVQGTTRYVTAVALSEYAVGQAWTDFGYAAIATGDDFPDGLTGGAGAGVRGGVLLLTTGSSLPVPTADTLIAHQGDVDQVAVLGGTAAVDSATFSEIRWYLP